MEFGPRGHSATGKVNGGELLRVGDIVAVPGERSQYLHRVKAMQGERIQIGNNRGGINGWITRRQIFGRLVGVE